MSIDISIILATKDRADQLKNMLSSLKQAIEGVSYELIIIEGTSSDNTSEVIRKFSPVKPQVYNEVKCLGPGNHSWAQLYNFGFSKAVGKWGMYASDDITFNVGCFSNAISKLNNQGDEIAGGVFFYKNPDQDENFHIDYTYGQKLLLNYGLFRLDHFRKVGGLDESYRFYCADGDLCLKFYEDGKRLIPLPGCFVTHFRKRDNRRLLHYRTAIKDIEKLQNKWKHFVNVRCISPKRFFWSEK